MSFAAWAEATTGDAVKPNAVRVLETLTAMCSERKAAGTPPPRAIEIAARMCIRKQKVHHALEGLMMDGYVKHAGVGRLRVYWPAD